VSPTGRIAAFVVLVALAIVVASALGATTRARPASAAAQAFARQDPSGARRDFVSVNGDGDTSGDQTRVTAATDGGSAKASAAAAVEKVDVFDGLVTADEVRARAAADGNGTSTSGAVVGLAIEGAAQEAPDGRTSYDLNGYGTVVALASGPTGILGLRVELTKDYKGNPAGSVVRIAYASAKAHDEVRAAAAKKPAAKLATKTSKKHAKKHHRKKRSAKQKLEDALSQRERDWGAALMQRPGYAFPVAGKHDFTDTFGAPRSDVPVHIGNDVFASFGTPIVAVADGRIYRVGTLKISGNRLWLRDHKGYRYFYAHLSDFAAAAYNGADVHAGEVIGFVGNTGDAEPTPPHLHFEVHMPNGAVVDPNPYLNKWDASGVTSASWLRRYGKDPGVRPGALVVVKDFLAE
jgi:murein DD-endopeptidase MepM/ murein hydrolase activator NlpD